ncbi:hypothetical protein K9N08_03315 [Candidatus Gracilibacteria bacterium]|nr:hypothetical protein [Candidatus Gracilibacteria bacterium]MCF7856560.1 hypothetical protein [Candidatus Gracilibacteria bacterium]MCF7896849.1 hypothetical protein [Candidatus Gracilibacteria bacterium]
MQKLFKILLVSTLITNLLAAPTFAAEFDPVADLADASITTDPFLNLNLPENFDETTPPETQPIISDTEPTTPTTPNTYLPGSGGAIEDSSNTVQPIYAPTVNEISIISYPHRPQVNLAETGPELILLIALLAALPLAWFLRKILYV